MKALESIRHNVFMAFQRFPVAVLASAVFCLLAIAEFRFGVIYATLLCTCFWSVSATLFAESRNLPKWYGIVLSLIGAGLFFLLFGSALEVKLPLLFLAPATFLSMGIAPYLRKSASAEQLGCFCVALEKNVAFTFFVTLVIFLGCSAILASLHYLFGLPFHGKVYTQIWLFCATFFAPVFAMGALPRDFRLEHSNTGYVKGQALLAGNVIMLLLLIYAAILWLYALKIGITMELPKGNVAYMVCSFAGIGMVIYLSSATPHAQAHRLLAFWQRHFITILSVPFVLLAIGIWTRISEYGVTEERYAVALMAVWLGGMMLYFLISSSERRPIILYASAVALLMLASFGPWGAVATSQRSQVGRLENILKQYDILQENNRISPADSQTVPKAVQAEITSIVAYLASTRKLDAICPWFSEQTPPVCTPRNAVKIVEAMGLEYMRSHREGQQQKTKVPFRREGVSVSARNAVNIRGYDYITMLTLIHREGSENRSTRLRHDTVDFIAAYDAAANRITLTEEGKEPLIFPLDGLQPYIEGSDKESLRKDDFYIEASNADYSGKIYVQHVNGYFDEDSVAHISQLSILLLYKHR